MHRQLWFCMQVRRLVPGGPPSAASEDPGAIKIVNAM